MIDVSFIQRYLAKATVGASTVRGQPSNTKSKATDFLIRINLADFSNISKETEFQSLLNEKTEELQNEIYSHSWGMSRKILNIFLIKALHDKYLSEKYSLDNLQLFLEVPLDNPNARIIRKLARKEGKKLPRWTSISRLKPENSEKYQAFSYEIAEEKGCKRYQLDFIWWNQ